MSNITANDINNACGQIAAFGDGGPTAGGTLTVNSVSLGSYDYYKVTGNTTISAFSSATYFTATADSVSAFCVFVGDLTINAGQVFLPANRKLFTVIYVTGNLSIAGSISMSLRGANHSASGSNIAAGTILIKSGTYSGVTNPEIPATGGSGAATKTTNEVSGDPGSAGTNGQSGGGGSGGLRGATSGSNGGGAAGTSFSGGPGGGAETSTSVSAGSGVANGGAGGAGSNGGSSQGAAGGAGNPGGAGAGSSPAGNAGTGGTLIIICLGAMSGAGTITAAGAQGGSGGSVAWAGGGGSGGGSVTALVGSGTLPVPSATGGLAGTGQENGGAGGDGTARILLNAASSPPFPSGLRFM